MERFVLIVLIIVNPVNIKDYPTFFLNLKKRVGVTFVKRLLIREQKAIGTEQNIDFVAKNVTESIKENQ